jgi:hypothetical protein
VLRTRTTEYSAENADSGPISEGVRNSELFGQNVHYLGAVLDLRMLQAEKTTDCRDVAVRGPLRC